MSASSGISRSFSRRPKNPGLHSWAAICECRKCRKTRKSRSAFSTISVQAKSERPRSIAVFGLLVSGGSDRLRDADLHIFVKKWVVEVVRGARRAVEAQNFRRIRRLVADCRQPKISNVLNGAGYGLHLLGPGWIGETPTGGAAIGSLPIDMIKMRFWRARRGPDEFAAPARLRSAAWRSIRCRGPAVPDGRWRCANSRS